MKNFQYVTAANAQDAVKALGPKALPLAGGTDLLNAMKDYALQPETLVNIKNIARTKEIAVARGSITIGANVTLTEILENEQIATLYPALVTALHDAGTPQIRNMATLGGNLCARPRCWYFRQEYFDCRKRGGTGCAAIEGDNELHAIFATDGPCVMVHPSSAAPPLIAYGASALIAGPKGERSIPLEDLFVAPAKKMESETALETNEILLGVRLQAPGQEPEDRDFPWRSATYEVRHKESHDWPLAMASVVFPKCDGMEGAPAIVLGAVAPIPWRAKAAESFLSNFLAKKKISEITETIAAQVAEKALEGAKPLSQNRYKIQIAKTCVKRAILAAASGKKVQ